MTVSGVMTWSSVLEGEGGDLFFFKYKYINKKMFTFWICLIFYCYGADTTKPNINKIPGECQNLMIYHYYDGMEGYLLLATTERNY